MTTKTIQIFDELSHVRLSLGCLYLEILRIL